jgi:hypothetical protein
MTSGSGLLRTDLLRNTIEKYVAGMRNFLSPFQLVEFRDPTTCDDSMSIVRRSDSPTVVNGSVICSGMGKGSTTEVAILQFFSVTLHVQ